jgi:hypothetical protein
MKLQEMTRYGEMKGNCLEACIASLLDVSIEALPDFSGPMDGRWFDRLHKWALEVGYSILLIKGDSNEFAFLNAYCIGIARIQESDLERHAVILKWEFDREDADHKWYTNAYTYHDPNKKCLPTILEFEEYLFIFTKP